jgi:pSer/pThr/pTyr-binding forkhead associated (FHA) protein
MTDETRRGVLRWSFEGKEHELVLDEDKSYTIGRSQDNAITFNTPKISRQHARIFFHNSDFYIEDLKSSNGTFVNGEHVIETTHILADRDVIAVYQITLIFGWETERIDPLLDTVSGEATIFGEDELDSEISAALQVEAGPDAGETFLIEKESVRIGRISRLADWEIRLSDRSVSRPHARIRHTEDGYQVEDLGSANGTSVNGQPVDAAPQALTDGDILALGESRLIFRIRTIKS